MKKGSSSSSAAAADGGGRNSLAIAERQQQKAAPSCVAAMFQVLAKRKLFSSSSKKNKLLLPPVRAQNFSPGRPPGGGGEKTPAAKMRHLLLDSADYARSKSDSNGNSRLATARQDNECSKISTPGVVARLMGLSSMPATTKQRPATAMDSSELGDGHRNADDAQTSWLGRCRHRVASPLKNPRSVSSSRNKARLIEAAARVLEPGLQSRNRHPARRHTHLLEYSRDGDVVASASGVLRNLPDQCSRNMCIDVHVPMSASLHNSTYNQWSEENGKKNATVRRTNQNVSCQVQPGGNSQGISEKARFKDSVQISNNAADPYQDFPKIQQRNICRGKVTCSPLKQNNLKQNTLPAACKAEDPGHVFQRQKHRTGERIVADSAKNSVSSNRIMDRSSSQGSKRETTDRGGVSCGGSSGNNKNLSKKGCRSNVLHNDSSNKLKLRTEPARAMEKDMIIAKGVGFVSEKPDSASPNRVRNGFRRRVESHNVCRSSDAGIVSFTFSSPMKGDPSTSLSSDNTNGTYTTALGSPNGPKRRYCKGYQNISSQRELDFMESVPFNRDECKNRDISGGRVTSSLTEKTAPSDEFLWQCNLVDGLDYGFGELTNPLKLCETLEKHKANAKYSNSSRSIPRGNNQPRPVPVLQSTYADKDSVSESPDDTTEAGFNGSHRRYPETCSTPPSRMQDATAQSNSSKAFLLRPPESALAAMMITTSSNSDGFKANHPLRCLASDFAMECLDSACIQLCDSRYRSFTKITLICTEERLAAEEVRKEMARYGAMTAGKSLDDLAASDADDAVQAGMSFSQEAFQVGAQIERDLLRELVEEMGLDMFHRL